MNSCYLKSRPRKKKVNERRKINVWLKGTKFLFVFSLFFILYYEKIMGNAKEFFTTIGKKYFIFSYIF